MSQKSSGYERAASDRYFTPDWVVDKLLEVQGFRGIVVDPAAGGWGIINRLTYPHLVPSVGFDIQGGGPNNLDWEQQDFYQWDGLIPDINTTKINRLNIVTNPPYGTRGKDAVSFITHALRHTRQTGGKVAMLLRVDFDSAKSRAPIFGGHTAFAAKYPILRRIHWSNIPEKFDDKGNLVQPSENHAWFVWDWQKKDGDGIAYAYL